MKQFLTDHTGVEGIVYCRKILPGNIIQTHIFSFIPVSCAMLHHQFECTSEVSADVAEFMFQKDSFVGFFLFMEITVKMRAQTRCHFCPIFLVDEISCVKEMKLTYKFK